MMQQLLVYFKIHSVSDLAWLALGIFAQLMFTFRFVIQWLVSEKQKRSVVPTAFWWFSLAGGVLLLAYGIQRGEPIIILGQALGLVVYIRNLMLVHQGKKTDLPTESKE